MVSIIRRMRKLKALLGIRIGPGAAVMPSEVTRIHMEFARKRDNGHLGPRFFIPLRFWRACLPRLKFHNPAIPMTINRTNDQKGPATMTIHFAKPITQGTDPSTITSSAKREASSFSDAQSTLIAPMENVVTVSMKHKNESEILADLLAKTKAVPLIPTEEEMDHIRLLEEQDRLSEQDSKRSQAVHAERRRTEAVLAQARAQGAVAKDL